jgi:hypothetical protein
MNRLRFIVPILLIFILGACNSTKEMQESRAEDEALDTEKIARTLESDRYIIKVNRHYSRGGYIIDVNPTTNFIAINQNRVRVNLSYVGRSYEIKPIAGINFSGQLIDKSVSTTKKGNVKIDMKVKKENDIFSIKLTILKSGQCDLSIGHPKIDYSRYSGKVYQLEASASEAVR